MSSPAGAGPSSRTFAWNIDFRFALFTVTSRSSYPWAHALGQLGATGIYQSAARLAPLLHEGFGSACLGMNALKGSITESLMDRLMMEGFFPETGRWVAGSSARVGNAGIDSIFFHTDEAGHIRNMLVGESKYGSSQLGMTRSGRQMSQRWIGERLSRTAKRYLSIAERLRSERVSRAYSPPGWRAEGKTLRIPLKGGNVAEVWDSSNGLTCYVERPISSAEIRLQAKRTTKYLQACAEGKIEYRCRISRYRANSDRHHITVQEWDPKAETLGKVTARFSGKYRDLLKSVQKGLRRQFEAVFRRQGINDRDVRQLADHACEDPQFFNNMRRDPSWNWRLGFDWQALRAAAIAGALGFAFDVVFGLAAGSVHWQRSIRTAAAAGAAGFVGYVGGIQIVSVLKGTQFGRLAIVASPIRSLAGTPLSSVLGTLGGSVLAAATFAYLSHMMGQTDIRAAHRQVAGTLASISTGTAFSGGVFGLAAAFGTASTGTAISSLSGAAATDATLAYLGFGSIASGVLGMAGGMAILSGGTLAVSAAVAIGVTYLFRRADDKSQRAVLDGTLEIVKKRLEARKQPEWA